MEHTVNVTGAGEGRLISILATRSNEMSIHSLDNEEVNITSHSGESKDVSVSQSLGTAEAEDASQSSIGSSRQSSFSKRRRDSSSRRQSMIRLSHKESAKNINVEALTANKLRFSSLGLVGRNKETNALKECLERLLVVGGEAMGEDDVRASARELVFIRGVSGTGKTALARTLESQTIQHEGLYLTGKFDFYLRDEPYSGFVAVCRELCGKILMLRNDTSTEAKYREIHDAIISELGDEISLLTNIFPILDEILDIDHASAPPADSSDDGFGKEGINYAFRKFLRVVSTHFKPLVIVLDDLQWGDAASFELLETLITDRGNPQIMVIGCYRSNEVDDTHFLSKMMRDLREKKENDGFRITDIYVGNLDVPSVNQIVIELLSVDSDASTLDLAKICHKRTMGNGFHLMTFLSMLKEEGMLDFNLGLFQWKWDISEIERETSAAANVVDLLKKKMNKQTGEVFNLLQLASCLGSSFDENTLFVVWEALGLRHRGSWKSSSDGDEIVRTRDELQHLLDEAIDEVFLEVHGESHYRWVHDKVQEAAMSLVTEEKMQEFQLDIGEILLLELSETELRAAIFVVANLLNAKEVSDPVKRTKFAELNLNAAEKAKELSAFESSAKYGEKGIGLLAPDRWTSQKDLSLKIYSICAEAHYSNGNVAEMQKYCDEVLHQNDIPILEKMRVYHCMLTTMGNGGRAPEALRLSINVLSKLGCKFPKNSPSQMGKAIYWLSKTKLPSEDEIAELPLMTDPTHKACMQLMINAATYAHYCSNTFAMVLINTCTVRWTMKYGIDLNSPSAFAILGFIKVLKGDLKAGNAFSQRALMLLSKLESKTVESRVTYLVYFMVAPWAKPLQSTLPYLLRGYKVGMEIGDSESAMWNVSMYIMNSFTCGKSLKALEADCKTYCAQMRELRQEEILCCTLPFWQGILNLIHGSENPLILSGDAIESEDAFIVKVQPEHTPRNYLHVLIFKSFMCSFYGNHELGAKLALERGDAYFKKNGTVLVMSDFFHQALSLFAMSRKTKKHKYVKRAKQIAAKIKSWVKKGNPNVNHYIIFLDAEKAAFYGQHDKARILYSQAFSTASRTGFQQDAALVSERFGEFLLYDLGNKERAVPQLKDAIRLYSNWGAIYKADILRKKHSSLWSNEMPEIVEWA